MGSAAATSYFDSIMESTSPVVDAVFGKAFNFRWQGMRCVGITAILSAQPVMVDADGQLMQTVHTHNFEINSADLKFGGVVTDPQAGMEIEEPMADGSVNVYEIRPQSKTCAFNNLDAESTRILIYANFVHNEP